jgi:aspartyl/asparaginyl beta-hydroxylase (cupin superfamily)
MSSPFTQDLRTQYARLIEMLMASGGLSDARECAQMAVRQGLWKDPLQRPTDFDDTLPAEPLLDPSRFWFVSHLEKEFATIRDEVARVVDPRRSGFSEVEEPLVAKGRWEQVVFYEGGIRMDNSCRLFPKTAALIAGIPEAVQSGGVATLSWLYGGTHIAPHCGATNKKLRVHLGVKVPKGASMRVGDRQIIWHEGRCVVFDDSFEHEVWNMSDEPRIVLLFDITHPALPAVDEPSASAARAELEYTVRQFLASRGIAGVERDPATDELTVFPDEPTARTIRRYMKDYNVTRVELAGGSFVMD